MRYGVRRRADRRSAIGDRRTERVTDLSSNDACFFVTAQRVRDMATQKRATAKSTGVRTPASTRSAAKPAKALPSALEFAQLRFVADTWRGGKQNLNELSLILPASRWESIEEAAMEWTYIARSRQRWISSDRAHDEHNTRAAALLKSYGITDADIQYMARAHLVEVLMRASDSDDGGWSLRILPWEHLISAATSPYRHGDPITVIRSMLVDRELTRPKRAIGARPTNGRTRILYVESAPAETGTIRSFKGQRELVAMYLTGDPEGPEIKLLYSPSARELAEAIATVKPHIVHLTGFDAHEYRLTASTIANAPNGQSTPTVQSPAVPVNEAMGDGFVLAKENGEPAIVNPETLAFALTGERQWFPWLVAFNIENSSARLAPRVVQFGATAAVGIQDTLAGGLADRFYGTFYSGIRRGLTLSIAFQRAWRSIRTRPGTLTGSGVVLWTSSTEVSEKSLPGPRLPAASTATLVSAPDIDPAVLSGQIKTVIVPRREINYSQLHNDGSLFDEFAIRPHPDHIFKSVRVAVTLCAGTEDAQYSTVVDLAGQPLDLRSEIRVALSAQLIRGVHEAIGTTVTVDIRWGEHILHQNTYPIRLLPSDQWRDAMQGRSWLPSFIFPRDPATTALVARASAYIRVIEDDPSSGFTGYGRLVSQLSSTSDCDVVDTQVYALWSTIVHEWAPGYINPPPTYSLELDSQRLRTPSMVARDGHGTCIDLALLFAAALELIDVWPVVFLLNNHALVGYWRSHTYHAKFRKASREAASLKTFVTTDVNTNNIGGAQRFPWAVGRAMYGEVQMEILEGRLVPVETIWLTKGKGFKSAVAEGRRRMSIPDHFDFLIDVAIARRSNVTPLPIVGGWYEPAERLRREGNVNS